MSDVAGYYIVFILPDGRIGHFTIAEPDKEKAKAYVEAKHPEVTIERCEPRSAAQLAHLPPGHSEEWISGNTASGPS